MYSRGTEHNEHPYVRASKYEREPFSFNNSHSHLIDLECSVVYKSAYKEWFVL
jgi:hypothetical protein